MVLVPFHIRTQLTVVVLPLDGTSSRELPTINITEQVRLALLAKCRSEPIDLFIVAQSTNLKHPGPTVTDSTAGTFRTGTGGRASHSPLFLMIKCTNVGVVCSSIQTSSFNFFQYAVPMAPCWFAITHQMFPH